MTILSSKKKVFITLAFFLLSVSSMVMAENGYEQFAKFIKKKRINAAYIMLGGHRANFDALNGFLAPRAYPTVSENYFTFGFGGHLIHGKFLLGAEIHKFLKKGSRSNLEFSNFADAQLYLLNFGYLAYAKKGFMLYPLAGVGLGRLKITVYENNVDSFVDIGSLQRGSISNSSSIVVNLGMGMDYFFKYDTKKKGNNSIMVGIRAGYIISAHKNHWKVNYTQVADGPTSGLTGPYFRVVIGMGGWIEKLIKIYI